jgi:hypothetical protein
MKSITSAQEMIISRLTSLAAFRCDTSASQITTADTLTTLKNQQNTMESNDSPIEVSLSAIQQELSNVETIGEIGKVTKHDVSQLSPELTQFVQHWIVRENHFHSG